MTLKLSVAHLTVDNPEQALTFYRDTLGLNLVGDVSNGPFRWLTLVSPDQPDVQIVLSQPHAGRTQEDGDTVARLLAKGSLGGAIFSSSNLDATFEKLRAARADIVQEPTNQPWGVRDCAVRDPAGNMIRISQA
ncbi:VOC family protein [Comamonas sp. JC664]|uniref:VOC family protein n=1 Tax=Comamonas sp. JC664 TaxID=2801917 RepID=UPI00174ADA6B|nr:VOC family protein [Comamonas sp. JC664]MBL0698018.1 VOC family protein [Comamonas sp. JC664]GHG70863.1 glyoxalase [Comamonas sp. KCTC 72670]